MKKKVMIGIAVVIIIIAGLLVAVLSHLGSIIKTGVNTYGPGITKTEVRLSDVDISLFSGRAEIRGFYLGNPGTFTQPKALGVESIYVDVDEKSLTSDPIIIEKIEVNSPDITYEKRGGTDNFQTILNNIKESTKAGKEPGEKTGEKGEGKKIIIRDVIIRDGKITLVTPMLGGKEITVPLPEIHLTNIGQERGGATPAEAVKEIFGALYEKVTGPDIRNALDSQIKKLGLTLDETKRAVTGQAKAAGKEVEQKVKALEGKIKGFLGE